MHAWHSHRQSRSHFAFSSLSDHVEMRLFFISRNSFFGQNYRFLYHGDQKISWWRIGRWRAVNFEIHLCSSDMKSDCIWRSISIQYVQIDPDVNSDLRNGSFGVEIRDTKHVDLLTSRCTCTSTQVKIYTDLIASTDLWPQGMFTFLEMLAMVESESSFGAYVCHRRPAGLHRDERSCIGSYILGVDKKTGSQTRLFFQSTFLFYHGLSVWVCVLNDLWNLYIFWLP